MVRKLLIPALMAVLLAFGFAMPASAQPQRGLVNVAVGDVTIQVPIAVAATICDVTVAVLVGELRDAGETTCTTVAESEATITPSEPGRAPRGPQRGLVNVIIGDVTVQVPIAAAVNICDVTLAILVGQIFDDGEATCEAVAGAGASG
jgi:hypothetical protein